MRHTVHDLRNKRQREYHKPTMRIVPSTLAAVWLLPTAVAGYDAACIYPETMPEPFEAHIKIANSAALAGAVAQRVETPIVVAGALLASLCEVNCLATHDPAVLNALTLQRPLLVTPPDHHNAESVVLCFAQCLANFVGDGRDEELPGLTQLYESWQLKGVSGAVRPDLFQAVVAEDALGIFNILQQEDYHPFLIGQLVFIEIAGFAQTLGWNAAGDLVFDVETQTAVPCTSACMAYADISGYVPRNQPGRPITAENKYNVTDDDLYWQPLLESDGRGYFSRQEHVVPHFGVTARPFANPTMRETRISEAPNYNYRDEALQVVQELAATATDPVRQAQIKYYDDKLWVRALYEHAALEQFPEHHSLQNQILLSHAGAMAEYDALIVAWTEKRRHDLVRPTTVIQRWGSDELDVGGSTTIQARDFQAFIRVMPHSEFPSASASICTAYQEVADAYTTQFYEGGLIGEMTVGGAAGYGVNCQDEYVVGGPRLACDEPSFTVADMTDLKNQCGESRLWGGMHFTKAVPAAYELATGLADAAMERITKIRNNSTTFGGENEYFKGSARPVCASVNGGDGTSKENGDGVEDKDDADNAEEQTETSASPMLHTADLVAGGIALWMALML